MAANFEIPLATCCCCVVLFLRISDLELKTFSPTATFSYPVPSFELESLSLIFYGSSTCQRNQKRQQRWLGTLHTESATAASGAPTHCPRTNHSTGEHERLPQQASAASTTGPLLIRSGKSEGENYTTWYGDQSSERQWVHMSTFPRSGVRELQKLLSSKYYYVLKWESRFTLKLDAAKNMHYVKNFLKSQMFKIKFQTKKSVDTYVYRPQEWS